MMTDALQHGSSRSRAGDLVAVHAGQADIEEDELRPEDPGRLEGRGPVVGRLDVVAEELEQPDQAACRVHVVVDHEDSRARRAGSPAALGRSAMHEAGAVAAGKVGR